jgi:hypothetical protein
MRDYQGMADRIQERGHGPTVSIDLSARPVIKSPQHYEAFRVSLLDILINKSPAVVWILGVREIPQA